MEEQVTMGNQASEPTADGREGAQSFDGLLNSDKAYQGEFDRRVAKALETAKAKWEQQSQAQAVEKAQRRDEVDRERESMAHERARFEAEKRTFRAEMLLQRKGLPEGFSKFLIGQTDEETRERIEAFSAAFSAEVSKEVEKRQTELMRGRTPLVGNSQGVDVNTRIRAAAGLTT